MKMVATILLLALVATVCVAERERGELHWLPITYSMHVWERRVTLASCYMHGGGRWVTLASCYIQSQDERPNFQRYPMLNVTVYIPTFTAFDLICRPHTSIIIPCWIVNHIFIFLRININIHSLNTLVHSKSYTQKKVEPKRCLWGFGSSFFLSVFTLYQWLPQWYLVPNRTIIFWFLIVMYIIRMYINDLEEYECQNGMDTYGYRPFLPVSMHGCEVIYTAAGYLLHAVCMAERDELSIPCT